MLSAAARARFTAVLVGVRNPLNIGAAARALHDFGFSDLRIVNDFAAPLQAAQTDAAHANAATSAIAAHAVLHAARRFDTLAAAIADCTFIVGTTAIGTRELTLSILPLRQAAPQILSHLRSPGGPLHNSPGVPVHNSSGGPVHNSPGGPSTAPALGAMGGEPQHPAPSPLSALALSNSDTSNQPHARVALLFGSEKTGLTNDQLSHCHLLTTIPLFSPPNARHLSMNLGQSVAVCLYELTRDGLEHAADLPELQKPPPTARDRELLTQLLLDVLHTTGYIRRFPANATEPLIRQLVLKLGSTHRECMTWMGILRQILWHETHPPKSSEEASG
jgi:tRNA C32,U32 (ribose-2'-O)-methylase TrmJ